MCIKIPYKSFIKSAFNYFYCHLYFLRNLAKQTKQKTKATKQTPLMQQYNAIKSKHPSALLLFRVGDFYETFGDDAIKAARVLGITLTKRANGSAAHIELAGFPYHALDTYLPKLIRSGLRVAICEQLEDPKKTKKIVKRGVTELVTPGVAINDKILDHKQNNYLAAVTFDKRTTGVAFLDVSTGEFLLAEGQSNYIEKLMQSFQPAETIFAKPETQKFKEKIGNNFYTYTLDDWVFGKDYTLEKLLTHFKVNSLKGFGIEELEVASIAAGAILHYLNENQLSNLNQITNIQRIAKEENVWLDRFTIRNLELLYPLHPDGKALLDVLDYTLSPMGARMLKKWIALPLKTLQKINGRLNAVEAILKDVDLSDKLRNEVKQIGDLERLITRIALQKAHPREVLQLGKGLEATQKISALLANADFDTLRLIGEKLISTGQLLKKINNTLLPDAPAQINKGNVIANGISNELDDLRSISTSGKDHLLKIQQEEALRTGITSLKIGFNNVFGYYLEVTNAHKNKVPEEWIRKQTLTNAERYITEELKVYEEKILNAQEHILALEQKLYTQLLEHIGGFIGDVQHNAQLVATLDCLLSFASVALKNEYCKPVVNDALAIKIKQGRHPVIEKQLPIDEQYVPNDVELDTENQQIILITGPNMSGKSALLRQTALICIMAQIGCFVPAKNAEIGLLDSIFTRVGASDNISSGESTFMVEMNETASIVNNITQRSLILLDEIGRGTSTYDGISIAWSLAQYLHNNPAAKPKTLFATHYHELTELSKHHERIKNFSVKTKVLGNRVVFLRKLIPEATKHSFGIHVAQMAGMPKAIITQANKILKQLESKNVEENITQTLQALPKEEMQLSIFQLDDPLLLECKKVLENLDINTLTPVEALLKLNELQKMLNEKKN